MNKKTQHFYIRTKFLSIFCIILLGIQIFPLCSGFGEKVSNKYY